MEIKKIFTKDMNEKERKYDKNVKKRVIIQKNLK